MLGVTVLQQQGDHSHMISIVSCGPGGAAMLTDEARSVVADAEVIAGIGRLFDLFPNSKAERIVMAGGVDKLLDRLEAQAADRRMAVLVSGDAGLYSLAKAVRRRFGRERCRTVPGVSCIQVACARLNISWREAEIINVHHGVKGPDIVDVPDRDIYLVLTGPKANWGWIDTFKATLGADYECIVLQDLTLPEERIEAYPADGFDPSTVSPRTIIAFVRLERFL